MIEIIGWVCLLFLEGVTLFFVFRKKISDANLAKEKAERESAERAKVIAERDKIIEQTKAVVLERENTIAAQSKTIAEKEKIIAETGILTVGREKAKLDLRAAQFDVQDKLGKENRKYKDSLNRFADCIDKMATQINGRRDASEQRNRAIKCLTSEVLDSFCTYVEKAKTGYREDRSEIIESFIESEIVPFLMELNSAVSVLNSEHVLSGCANSRQPLVISIASLGPIKRCLLDLVPRLDDASRARLQARLVDLPLVGGTLGLNIPSGGGGLPS